MNAQLQALGPKLVLASHNKGKLAEISALLVPFGIVAVPASAFGLAEPAETEDSFAGNALLKARFAAQGSGLPALS
ncbi:MAG: non-canonical purine NTP pyrophosphatase, partial [Sandaracinobacteroides sp.]